MRIDFRQLKQLVVETLSGEKLGHVHDLVFDIDSQSVVQYQVKSSILSSREFFISPTQVIRFEEKRMVVDNTVKQIVTKSVEKKTLPSAAEPVSMRNIVKS